MDAIPDPTDTENSEQPQCWRDVLPVHPAAELFPLMGETELRELAADIEAHGLREPVDIYTDPKTFVQMALDGRNRLDALALISRNNFDWQHSPKTAFYRHVGLDDPDFDPFAYVISKNIKRRHLTPERKAEVIAKVLALDPTKSNRAIAAELKVDHKKVGAVRAEREATGEIPPVEKTTGKDGRARPAKRAPARTEASLSELGDIEQLPTPVEMAPMVSAPTDYDINRLRSAMREVEAQATAGNVTRLREAIDALVREGNRALQASRITLAPDHGLQ